MCRQNNFLPGNAVENIEEYFDEWNCGFDRSAELAAVIDDGAPRQVDS